MQIAGSLTNYRKQRQFKIMLKRPAFRRPYPRHNANQPRKTMIFVAGALFAKMNSTLKTKSESLGMTFYPRIS